MSARLLGLWVLYSKMSAQRATSTLAAPTPSVQLASSTANSTAFSTANGWIVDDRTEAAVLRVCGVMPEAGRPEEQQWKLSFEEARSTHTVVGGFTATLATS